MDENDVNFAAPEDVIKKKMEFYKKSGFEKHLRDITGILKKSQDMTGITYIEDWVNTSRSHKLRV